MVVTTNIFESLKFVMLKVRGLPILSMLEVLRMIIQQWFYDRRNEVDEISQRKHINTFVLILQR